MAAQQPSNFLRLPRELRDAIHELTLKPEMEKPLELQADPKWGQFTHPHMTFDNRPNVNWMLVSKCIHKEYMDVVRKCTTVRILTNGTWDLSRLREWLAHGVTTGLLQQLHTWTLVLQWESWSCWIEDQLGLQDLSKHDKGCKYGAGESRVSGWEQITECTADNQTALAKVLHFQEMALASFMPEWVLFTWEVNFPSLGLYASRDWPAEGDSVTIEAAQLRAAIQSTRRKVRFIAHVPLYFRTTHQVDSGEVQNAKAVDPWLVSSAECAKYTIEPSSEEGNVWGWACSFESTYTRLASARTSSNKWYCSIWTGRWMPHEVYKAQ